MTDSSRVYERFLAEMKRRRVFRVMAVYGIVGFLLLQIMDLVVPALLLPEWTYRFLALILLLGFPVALVLAWAFEMTPEGMRRTADATPEELGEMMSAPASKRLPAGLMALVGVVALVVGAWWVGTRTAPDSGVTSAPTTTASGLRLVDLSEDTRPSIAVLPFVNMSADENQEYFSDGITEEILNVLAKIPELRAAGRTSAFAYKGENKDLREIGDELGVDYLIEGSVRKAGDQLRITAQLIDTADGSHLWSESYNEELTAENVFEIQAKIADAIAGELALPLGLDNASDLITPTADLEAYDLYLAGRAHIRERGQGLNEAIKLFEAAIARDSSWAPAWAGLAEATELLSWYPDAWDGGRPEERTDLLAKRQELQDAAEQAAIRALELDPSAASAHVALGSVYRYRHDWDRSEAEYLRALEIDPDNPEAFHQYSEMLSDVGRSSESVRTAERALSLDPAPIRILMHANALLADGRLEESIEQVQEGIVLDPEGTEPGLRSFWFYVNLEAGHYEAMFDHASDSFVQARENLVEGLESGDLSQVPVDLRLPSMWMIVGQPDSAAARIIRSFTDYPNQYNGWIWNEIFDPIREHPLYLETLKLVNLEGRTPQQTPR